jgi:hypothetical protein
MIQNPVRKAYPFTVIPIIFFETRPKKLIHQQ